MAETTEQYFEGVGRRKEATARARLYPQGSGRILVNDKPVNEYFGREIDQIAVNAPLKATGADPARRPVAHTARGHPTRRPAVKEYT